MLDDAHDSAVALAAALALAGLVACSSTPLPVPTPTIEDRAELADLFEEPLDRALAAYREGGDIEPLRAWLEDHPEHPDASLWREVVALRSYERAIEQAVDAVEPGDPIRLASADLHAVALAYPGTLVARTAQAALGEYVLTQLRNPVLSRRTLDFMEGRTAWSCDDEGRPLAPDLDLDRFRARHEASVRDAIGRTLQAHGCKSAVGWCAWWVERYPEATVSASIRSDLDAVWYRRAHPPWKSRKHLRCAHACARTCRSQTTPLDDSCYTSCFAGC